LTEGVEEKVVRIELGLEREEGRGDWRKMQYEELYDSYSIICHESCEDELGGTWKT
jgi:hypothetical protein